MVIAVHALLPVPVIVNISYISSHTAPNITGYAPVCVSKLMRILIFRIYINLG